VRVLCAGPVIANVFFAGLESELELASLKALVVLSTEGAVQGTAGLDSALWYIERADYWLEDEVVGAPPFARNFVETERHLDEQEVEQEVELPDLEKIRAALERGERVFETPLVAKRIAARIEVALPAEVAQLASWFDRHGGPQRQTLADFEALWLSQVLAFDAEARKAAVRLLSKAVRSPKVESERARVLGLLAQSR